MHSRIGAFSHGRTRRRAVAPGAQKAHARHHRRRARADDRVPEDADAAPAAQGGARRLRAGRRQGTEPQVGQGLRGSDGALRGRRHRQAV